jgi:peptidoglycan/LPS O-acetylase OafA/YrhL
MLSAHPVLVLLPLAVAILCSVVLARFRPSPPSDGRYRSIDGLRGYLAFCVFLHHALIWYLFTRTGRWETPSSHLFTHFGEASVSFFFMITAFLFYGKLLDNKTRETDWLTFFVGRTLRLAPLYFLVVCLVLVLVVVQSNGMRVDSLPHLAKVIGHWFLFTAVDEPAINGVFVQQFVAGVNWSLPYEWYFYLSMPILALSAGQRGKWQYLLLSSIAIVFVFFHATRTHLVDVFAYGIIAAVLVRFDTIRKFARTWTASATVAVCLTVLVFWFPSAHGFPQHILLAIAFTLIAAGADLFGILSASASHALGELSYGIYLLHGLVLFLLIHYAAGAHVVQQMSPQVYWGVIAALVPVLLIISSLAFRFVELPAIRSTSQVSAWLRRHGRRMATASFTDPLEVRNDRDMRGPLA